MSRYTKLGHGGAGNRNRVCGFSLLICLFVTIAVTWLYCRIFSKVGYNWVLGLLTLIPILNIIMFLGLGDWPVLR